MILIASKTTIVVFEQEERSAHGRVHADRQHPKALNQEVAERREHAFEVMMNEMQGLRQRGFVSTICEVRPFRRPSAPLGPFIRDFSSR
jgi:hypothetical protein